MHIFFLGRVILNLGLPSFLINTVLSLLCCTQKSTNKLWQTLSVAQLKDEQHENTKTNFNSVHKERGFTEIQLPWKQTATNIYYC